MDNKRDKGLLTDETINALMGEHWSRFPTVKQIRACLKGEDVDAVTDIWRNEALFVFTVVKEYDFDYEALTTLYMAEDSNDGWTVDQTSVD